MFFKKLVVCLFLLTLVATVSIAQQTLGIIKGRVLDESGALVPGAKVTVSAGQFSRTVVSGNDGSFSMVGVPTGNYAIKASSPGLAQYQNLLVQVNAGGTTSVDIPLKVQSETQQVTVQETAGTQLSTDPSSNVGALVLRGEDLEALSDDPDDLAFIDGFTGGRLPPQKSPFARSASTRIPSRLNMTTWATAASRSSPSPAPTSIAAMRSSISATASSTRAIRIRRTRRTSRASPSAATSADHWAGRLRSSSTPSAVPTTTTP